MLLCVCSRWNKRPVGFQTGHLITEFSKKVIGNYQFCPWGGGSLITRFIVRETSEYLVFPLGIADICCLICPGEQVYQLIIGMRVS